ncbi:uncharacterized protein [Gossypium hirsutum]|uniref:Retrotransposon gag domain-containing protein n=1 Tax=Gossypium hirsutum TaxID=3635 RepID=A0A1U8HNA3_GOSHI|nr:uncharacterized protein LOC107887810 [Gossypium hirsutum]
MGSWFMEFMRTDPVAQKPLPPIVLLIVPTPLQTTEFSLRTPTYKTRKYSAEEFRGRSDDDLAKAEYRFKNIQRVFYELACSPNDYPRCVVLLLKDEAYSWWTTLIAVVLRDKVTLDFFQSKFKKKYVSKRYLDRKKKEFLELNQGNKSVVEYLREFVHLSKYAHEIVLNEEELCIHFEDGLNDEINMMIRGTEI